MATTRKYLNHLLQNTGITPACSEEEREAAEDIAQIFVNHGFEPEIQEFNAPTFTRLPHVIIGILLFLGSILYGIGGAAGIVGLACMTVVMVCVLSGCSGGVSDDQVKGQLVSVEKPEWANNPESP